MIRLAGAFALLGALHAQTATAPPAASFGRQLWTNTRGLIATENVVPGLVGVIGTGSATLVEDRVQSYFGGERVAPWIGDTGNVLGSAITIGGASGALFAISYRGRNERLKAMSFDLTQAFTINMALTYAVKFPVGRERPDKSNNHSFLSGHASTTTAAAAVVARYYPKAAIPAYLLAAFVGFSRIEKNRHWLSDVVAGHTLGFVVGQTVVRGKNPLQFGRVNWAPSIAPGGGLAVNASIDLSARR